MDVQNLLALLMGFLNGALDKISVEEKMLELRKERLVRLRNRIMKNKEVNPYEVMGALFSDLGMAPVSMDAFVANSGAVGGSAEVQTQLSREAKTCPDVVKIPENIVAVSWNREVCGRWEGVRAFIMANPGVSTKQIFAWALSQGMYKDLDSDRGCLTSMLNLRKRKDEVTCDESGGKFNFRYSITPENGVSSRVAKHAVPVVVTQSVVEVTPEDEEDEHDENVITATSSVDLNDDQGDGIEEPPVLGDFDIPDNATPLVPETVAENSAQSTSVTLKIPIVVEKPISVVRVVIPLPSCPQLFNPGSLKQTIYGFIWANDGVTIDEIKSHIKQVLPSGFGQVENTVKSMRTGQNGPTIYSEMVFRGGASKKVFKSSRKESVVAAARKEAGASPKSKESETEGDEVSGHKPKNPDPPPPKHLRTISSQDDWTEPLDWLIRAIRRKGLALNFEIICVCARSELIGFGLDQSTTPVTVIENGLRQALLAMQDEGRLSIGDQGKIALSEHYEKVVQDSQLEEEIKVEEVEDEDIILPTYGDSNYDDLAIKAELPELNRKLYFDDDVEPELIISEAYLPTWQSVCAMESAIRELLVYREDIENEEDIVNALCEEGTKNWKCKPDANEEEFRFLVNLARISLHRLVSLSEVHRDWAGFLMISQQTDQ